MFARFLAAVAACSVVPLAHAASGECTAKSGPGTAALIELYTSEGCDSCPPADAWLRKLPAAATGEVVPLSFHVDYWDPIGWKILASPAFARGSANRCGQRTRVVYAAGDARGAGHRS
jgi:hypothetical protein